MKVNLVTYPKKGLDPQGSIPKVISIIFLTDVERAKTKKKITKPRTFGVKCVHFGLFIELYEI